MAQGLRWIMWLFPVSYRICHNILWLPNSLGFKIASEIALSTTESKYIFLSMATRELLPLWWLVQELHKNSFISTPLDPVFSHTMTNSLKATKIFEDNASYADFAGLWHRDFTELSDCSLSRTGYVITYCGCPIHWASKLQVRSPWVQQRANIFLCPWPQRNWYHCPWPQGNCYCCDG